jgi:CRP-like cAMP-binding protein
MLLTSEETLTLSTNALFKGLASLDIVKALYCLRARAASFKTGELLCEEGDPATKMGIILEGEVDLVRYEEDGGSFIIETFQKGDSFGEVYAIKENATFGVNALARKGGKLLWLEIAPLYDEIGCPFGRLLFKNLVNDLAEKDLLLKRKVTILSQKGLKNKVLLLLETYAPKKGGWFILPFSRDAMAAYLACERSALSRLLSSMQDEGLLAYKGNRFILKNPN